MPVGAIIGGGLSLAGAVVGSSAQSKAANKAADTSLAVADKNNALTRDIYNQNKAGLSPFMQRGNAAGNQINALLGLGGGQQQTYTPQPAGATQTQFAPAMSGEGYYGVPGLNTGAVREDWGRMSPGDFSSRGAYTNALAQYGAGQGIPMANVPNQFYSGQQPPAGGISGNQGVVTGQSAQDAANNAFDIFRNSTGYQFRLGEGLDAVNSGYAGAGTLQSGAAMRGIQDYAQNFASNEFGNYMNALQNQQGVGLGGASALAGVGQNYAGMVSQNNNSAGTAAANAALVQGANNPFASALGTLGGTILSGGLKF